MNVVKKMKFHQIFKRGMNWGAEYELEHDKDYIFQNELMSKHEVVLPLPIKISNGELCL